MSDRLGDSGKHLGFFKLRWPPHRPAKPYRSNARSNVITRYSSNVNRLSPQGVCSRSEALCPERIRAKIRAHREAGSVSPKCKSMQSRKAPMPRNKIVFSAQVRRILRQQSHKCIQICRSDGMSARCFLVAPSGHATPRLFPKSKSTLTQTNLSHYQRYLNIS